MPTKNNPENLIGTDKFYLIVQNEGYYLKTSFINDYYSVLEWGNGGDIIFRGIVKSSDWIHYRTGSTWLKRRISQLHIAKNSEILGYQDIENLDLKNASHILEVNVGGYNLGKVEKL